MCKTSILLFTFLAMDSFAQTSYIEAKMNETNEIELFYLDTKGLCVLFVGWEDD